MPKQRRQNQLDPDSAEGFLGAMVPDNTFRAVTPSDTKNIKGGPARALYIGVSGDVVVLNENDAAVTFKAVPVGILPISTNRVNATGTTATDIVAL